MSSLEESANRMQEIFPQSITITPILKRRGSEEQGEAKRRRGPGGEQQGGRQGDSGEGRQKAPGHLQLEPSWSLGCLYRCAICSVKFQTLSSFQSHLFFHRSTPEQYMALHGDPGVQFRHHACLRCGEMVQQVLNLNLHPNLNFNLHLSGPPAPAAAPGRSRAEPAAVQQPPRGGGQGQQQWGGRGQRTFQSFSS